MYLIKAELGIIAFLLFVTAIATKVGYGIYWSVPFWLLFVGVMVVFRHPRRATPSSPLALVSPIDAKVEAVLYGVDPFQGKERKIIRLSRRNSGILGLYSPTEGQVVQTWYGEQYERPVPGSSKDRGHVYTAWIQTDEKDDVLISFYRAKLIRYLQIHPQPGERVGQGKVIGLSSAQYVDILLPDDSVIKVEAGQKLRAGESILGVFVHRNKRKDNFN